MEVLLVHGCAGLRKVGDMKSGRNAIRSRKLQAVGDWVDLNNYKGQMKCRLSLQQGSLTFKF